MCLFFRFARAGEMGVSSTTVSRATAVSSLGADMFASEDSGVCLTLKCGKGVVDEGSLGGARRAAADDIARASRAPREACA
jgi:hypothetical protein